MQTRQPRKDGHRRGWHDPVRGLHDTTPSGWDARNHAPQEGMGDQPSRDGRVAGTLAGVAMPAARGGPGHELQVRWRDRLQDAARRRWLSSAAMRREPPCRPWPPRAPESSTGCRSARVQPRSALPGRGSGLPPKPGGTPTGVRRTPGAALAASCVARQWIRHRTAQGVHVRGDPRDGCRGNALGARSLPAGGGTGRRSSLERRAIRQPGHRIRRTIGSPQK